MRSFLVSAPEKIKNEWDVEAAIGTYNIDGWGTGYFTVNGAGNVQAMPLQEAGGSIDLLEVVNEARARGLSFPLVVRFQDLLRHRVEAVNRAFGDAIKEFNYGGQYRGVFPIKVNQLREVIEEIVDAGQQFHFGLEAGSKPELVAALAMHKDPESLDHLQRLQGSRLHSHRAARTKARQACHHRGRETRRARTNDSRG